MFYLFYLLIGSFLDSYAASLNDELRNAEPEVSPTVPFLVGQRMPSTLVAAGTERNLSLPTTVPVTQFSDDGSPLSPWRFVGQETEVLERQNAFSELMPIHFHSSEQESQPAAYFPPSQPDGAAYPR